MVFPKDSADPPSGNVPTRNNSPSDIAFAERDDAAGWGSHVYRQCRKREFYRRKQRAERDQPQAEPVLTKPFDLPADHYFIVPQVLLSTGENFFWLSAPKPNPPPDLQAGFATRIWRRTGFVSEPISPHRGRSTQHSLFPAPRFPSRARLHSPEAGSY